MKVLILENTQEDIDILKLTYSEACSEEHSFDEVTTYKEMRELYLKNDYDIVFMNIDIENSKVFDFVKAKANERSEFIILAMDNDKMIEAYKHKIAGFLTRPVQKEAFSEIIDKVHKRLHLCDNGNSENNSHFKELIDSGKINRIALTTLDGYVIVHYDGIIRCEANGNYTSVYFHDGSFLMLTKTLKHYASQLENNGFFRVHKTHLVNLNYIRSYVKGKHSYVELKDGSHIEVSSRKRQTLVEILNN